MSLGTYTGVLKMMKTRIESLTSSVDRYKVYMVVVCVCIGMCKLCVLYECVYACVLTGTRVYGGGVCGGVCGGVFSVNLHVHVQYVCCVLCET